MIYIKTTQELIDLLEIKTINELENLAKLYKIRGYSSFSKPMLISNLCEAICKMALKLIQILDEHDRLWFEQLLKQPTLFMELKDEATIEIFFKWNILFVINKDITKEISKNITSNNGAELNAQYIIIPIDIKDAYYNEFNRSEFIERKNLIRQIKTYRNGLLNLYGAVELWWFEMMFNLENDPPVDFHTLIEILEDIHLLYGGCKLIQDYVVHEYLYIEDEEMFLKYKELTRSLDYYEPSKEEVVLMADENYYAEDKSTQHLQLQFQNFLQLPKERAKMGVLLTVLLSRTSGLQGEELLDLLVTEWAKVNILIIEETLIELKPAILSVIDNTRTWTNKGFTPKEVKSTMLVLYNQFKAPTPIVDYQAKDIVC
ncbi:MAG: hypothetical protein ATN36_03035 [Epulopiscium sp. Nele67-Bin005]|nr:MAG: hypothetical protein ATN36_03035 [Epulopiscium sp. Nele67-Bin005]